MIVSSSKYFAAALKSVVSVLLHLGSGELEFLDDCRQTECVAFAFRRGDRVEQTDIEVGLVGALADAKEIHDIALAQDFFSNCRRR